MNAEPNVSQLTKGTPSQRFAVEVSIVVCDIVWVISVVVDDGESVEQETAKLVIAMASVIFTVVEE